jgi:riboflavin kinase/FMN adenylyltransferase
VPPCVLVIGNFDGVHVGHRALLAEARAWAASDAVLQGLPAPLPVKVLTFWPHPLSVVSPGQAPKLLTALPERVELLKAAGADEVRVVTFNRQVADWSPRHFVDCALAPLSPTVVVVGANFRYGRDASGGFESLREQGEGRFAVRRVELVAEDGTPVSSSAIRAALARGDVAGAARSLGRQFRVRGVVVTGDRRGRSLGYPTANLPVSGEYAVPGDGVYVGWLTVDGSGEKMPAAISVGANPTFDGIDARVEAHAVGRDDLELYGREVAVDFAERLRGMVKFAGVDELVAQLRADVARTREILGG